MLGAQEKPRNSCEKRGFLHYCTLGGLRARGVGRLIVVCPLLLILALVANLLLVAYCQNDNGLTIEAITRNITAIAKVDHPFPVLV